MTVREHGSASRKPTMLAMAAAVALALSACGGAGSGPGTPSGGSGAGGRVSSPPPTVVYANAAEAADTAAAEVPANRPLSSLFASGSGPFRAQPFSQLTIYQVSAGLSSASSFFPPVRVGVDPYDPDTGSAGPLAYSITYRPTPPPDESPLVGADVVFATATGLGNRYGWNVASAAHGTATYTKDDDTTVSLHKATLSTSAPRNTNEDSSEAAPARVAQAIVFTDYEKTANDVDDSVDDDTLTPLVDESKDDTAGDDTDYMAAGVWVSGPSSGDDPNGFTNAGAFAMGMVPYAGLDAAGYDTVTATYNGVAGGKRFGGGKVTDFTTTVSLNANFSGAGSISGTVKDVGGGQSLTLTFGTMAEATAGGPYSGTTQVGSNTNFTGTWGGAFFGKEDTTNGPPGTAGTFGASISADNNNGNSDSILGVFIAHRDDSS